MGDCNPACQKIIINSGLMAILSDWIAVTVGPDHALYRPATVLAHAARQLTTAWEFLADVGALVPTGDPAAWKGCEEAYELIKMVANHDASGVDVYAMVNRLEAMHADIIHSTQLLVSGELR